MLKLRLQRRGKRGYATYRVVVAEQHAPVKGRFLADVGSYNPHQNAFTVDKEAVTQWLAQGAQPSATVHNLLVTHGIVKADKVTIWRPPHVAAATEEATPRAPHAATEDTPAPATETKLEEAPPAKET